MLAYWPGLHGDFFLDDYPNIVHNIAIAKFNQPTLEGLQAVSQSSKSGPLGRPLALVSFALNHAVSGFNPFYFKAVNLILHLCTAVGLYVLVRLLLSTPGIDAGPRLRRRLPLLAVALWTLHPLHASTVLYVVQRMTILATLFMVWGMVAYCRGRLSLLAGAATGWAWIAGALLIGLTGLFAKETAGLIYLYVLAVELTLLRFRAARPAWSWILALGLLLPILIGLLALLVAPGSLLDWLHSGFSNRSFTLGQRLLTESRVVGDYLIQTVIPNVTRMGIFHDDYEISRGLLTPPSTLATLAAHVSLLTVGLALRKRAPLFTFGVAWFYFGHLLESTVLPLELKFEHRNYLPLFGPLVALTAGMLAIPMRILGQGRRRIAISLALVTVFAVATAARSTHFGDYIQFGILEAENHPTSSRANQEAAINLMKLMMQTGHSDEESIARVRQYLDRSISTNQQTVAPLFTAVIFLPQLTGERPPAHYLHKLVERLRRGRVDANLTMFYVALNRSAMEKTLFLNEDDVKAIYEAPLQNPEISARKKADILAGYAMHVLVAQGNLDMARDLIDEALHTAPNHPGVYPAAIHIYRKNGMDTTARQLRETLDRLDPLGIFSNAAETP